MTPTAPRSSSTRLAGWRLALARFAWLALTLLTCALMAFLLPQAYAEYRAVCAQPPCQGMQASAEATAALGQMGVSLAARALVLIACDVVTIVAYTLIGIVIFALRSDDWVAILTSLLLITFGAVTTVVFPAQRLDGPARPLAALIEASCLAALIVTLYVFPNGQFVPGWARWLGVVWVAWITGSYLLPGAPFSTVGMSFAQFLFFRLAWYSTGVAAQVYRYRSHATTEQRQQTKWVVLGAAGAMLIFFGAQIPMVVLTELAASEPAGALYRLATLPVTTLGLLLVPIGVGLAMLRFRLWDVDVLINRALVYSSLTAALALIYLAGVTVAQSLFRALTGQESDIAVAVSTLAAAGLLHPLRQGFQRFIDRRFYRRKYDAERVLAGFSAAIRDEIEIERLTPALLAAIEEAVQPAHISLWLPPRR